MSGVDPRTARSDDNRQSNCPCVYRHACKESHFYDAAPLTPNAPSLNFSVVRDTYYANWL